MTERITTLISMQALARAHGMRVSALAVHPDTLEELQKDLLDLQKLPIEQQPLELVGIQLIPWYPETQRLQSRMTHLKLIQGLGAYLRDNGIGMNRAEGKDALTPEEYTELIYKFLGVDLGTLMAEQDDIKARMPERAQDPVTLAENASPEEEPHKLRVHKGSKDGQSDS